MIAITKLRDAFKRHPTLKDQVDAFRDTFARRPARDFVLPAIAEYCGVAFPLPTDLTEMQRIAGRQDVWWFIKHHLDLSDTEIMQLLQGSGPTRRQLG